MSSFVIIELLILTIIFIFEDAFELLKKKQKFQQKIMNITNLIIL